MNQSDYMIVCNGMVIGVFSNLKLHKSQNNISLNDAPSTLLVLNNL